MGLNLKGTGGNSALRPSQQNDGERRPPLQGQTRLGQSGVHTPPALVCPGCGPGLQEDFFFSWAAGLQATARVLSPNPYCSIVRKACKQEPPSVTSEWFERTNIITRVFMEECLGAEAERA